MKSLLFPMRRNRVVPLLTHHIPHGAGVVFEPAKKTHGSEFNTGSADAEAQVADIINHTSRGSAIREVTR